MRHDESAAFVPAPHPKTAPADVERAEGTGAGILSALPATRSGCR